MKQSLDFWICWTKVPTHFPKWNSETFYGLIKDKITFCKLYSILIWCWRVFLWWNNLPNTQLQYSPLKTWMTGSVVTDFMTKLTNLFNLLKSIYSVIKTHKNRLLLLLLFSKPVKRNFQALFKGNWQFSRQIERDNAPSTISKTGQHPRPAEIKKKSEH